MAPKPVLVVVTEAINPASGSEPGKGWYWTRALSRLYRLHIICSPSSVPVSEKLIRDEGWDAELCPTRLQVDWAAWDRAWQYRRWCDEALEKTRELAAREHPVGVHHITLGSTKILPRYDRLGIPYTLGPLGGGEAIPFRWLFQSGLTLDQVAGEALRHVFNHAVPLVSGAVPVLRGARRILVTTDQTRHLLDHLGVKVPVHEVFPDVFEQTADLESVLEGRRRQAAELAAGPVRLLWYGRGQWWKGAMLALELVKASLRRGTECHLTIVAGLTTEMGRALPGRIRTIGLEKHVTLENFLPREGIMERIGRSHALVYPSMRDSSSSVIPECFACGLPAFTLGLAGIGVAEGPGRIVASSKKEWLAAGAARLQAWKDDPESWVKACAAALERSRAFGFGEIENHVRKHLAPDVFSTDI